jgi:sec-independent protein translocase protein TatB
MFDSIGWGEILVLVIAGLFILGPERLPGAAAWLGRTINQVKSYATGATAQLREEMGPDFDELRKPVEELRRLRGHDPRRMALDSLLREPSADTSKSGPAADG